MEKLTLNGRWQLQQAAGGNTFPATVPGCVHTDLLAAGHIPDPFYRDNELQLQWIGETDWHYQRTFELSADFLAHEQLLLHCAGLDTLATVWLNGRLLVPIGHHQAQTDNQFRCWEFDAKPVLRQGENEIVIQFAAPLPYARRRLDERFLANWGTDSHKLPGGNWLRKSQCNFGWDWGPKLTTSGIWQSIELVGYNSARLGDLHLQQDHSQPDTVTLTVQTAVDAQPGSHGRLTFQLSHNGQPVAQASQTWQAAAPLAPIQLTVTNPKLWWPNGLGEQPLYNLAVQLTTADGRVLDQWHKRIGLRTLQLDRHPDQWGESFQFVVNGLPFFAKGANWIPADAFVTRITPERYTQLLQDTAVANMNMLRVWGGGIYEPDLFYDLCDELGICIWQDFMFACAAYPTFDDAWLQTFQAEAEEQVRRLRHHACLALWCGNNEMEQGLVSEDWTPWSMSWQDYGRVFDELLPAIIAQLDPQTDYWPSSPHTPIGDRKQWNDPTSGDAHIWDVWHGKQPFEFYRTCAHRFNSEFGFQSFPEPRMVAQYTAVEDRNITSFVMEHHQRSGIGNQTIIHYLLDWFRLATGFEQLLWLSQIVQALAMKYAVEHWRRSMPRGMGTLYWQLNDCWPVASWSSIDADGRWKALHYLASDFFAPLLVSGVENIEAGTVEVHITSDRREAVTSEVQWQLQTVAGELVDDGRLPHTILPGQNCLLQTIDLQEALATYGPRQLLLWLTLTVDGRTVSTNLVHFVRPKHLELADPQISWQVTGNQKQAQVTLTSQKPALFVWLSLQSSDGRFSDNFFHLQPGLPVTVTVERTVDETAWADDLTVCSLYHTYQPS